MVTDNYCNVRTLSRSSIFFLQVAVLIDTSASMASRLFLVKDKLYRLMQVRTGHFTAIHFIAVLESSRFSVNAVIAVKRSPPYQ